jgi:hypothetical protein
MDGIYKDRETEGWKKGLGELVLPTTHTSHFVN